jgi:hypothetical protein
MIVQILAVIDRSSLNFIDGFVDLVNCVLFFFVHVISGRWVLQVSAGVPKIGKGVQVCRMSSRLVSKTHSGAKSNEKRE